MAPEGIQGKERSEMKRRVSQNAVSNRDILS